MKQLQIRANVNNRTFKTKLSENTEDFSTKLKEGNKNISVVHFSSSGMVDVDTRLNDASVQMNTPIDIKGGQIDEYYDEIIFYDGGGVEGYGY